MVKNKRAVSRRRYHSVPRDALRLFSTPMYRYALRHECIVLKYERAAFLIP